MVGAYPVAYAIIAISGLVSGALNYAQLLWLAISLFILFLITLPVTLVVIWLTDRNPIILIRLSILSVFFSAAFSLLAKSIDIPIYWLATLTGITVAASLELQRFYVSRHSGNSF